jgi:hypothetical protein
MHRAFAILVAPLAVFAGLGGGSSAGQGTAATTKTRIESVRVVADSAGRYAVAWQAEETTPAAEPDAVFITEPLFVMLGKVGSAERVVRKIPLPGRTPSEFAIALDRRGRAIISWTDYAANRPIDGSPGRWSMARVDRAGNVTGLGQFDGEFESVEIARAPTGRLIAVASDFQHVVISTLGVSDPTFAPPKVVATHVRHHGEDSGDVTSVQLRVSGRNYATLLWADRYSPPPPSDTHDRQRWLRITFTGSPIGRAQTIKPPRLERHSAVLNSYDSFRGREAFAWIGDFHRGWRNWVSAGPVGHVHRAKPLGPVSVNNVWDARVAVSRSGRAFVVAGQYSHPHTGELGANTVTGWVSRRGLRHPLALTHGKHLYYGFRDAIRGIRDGVPLAVWYDGSRLRAAELTTTNRVRHSGSCCGGLKDADRESVDAAAVDRHRVLLAFAPRKGARVKVRLLHL